MKYLANENIPSAAIDELRKAGFDVAWVAEESAGASDSEVMDLASRDGRVLITFDKDFAELVFRWKRLPLAGAILLRVRPQSPQFVADTLGSLLRSDRVWKGHFSVVTETRIRMVPLSQE